MYVHVQTESHVSAVVRRAVRVVTCEKCHRRYRYTTVRRGVGRTTTVYNIGVARAKARAAAKAEKAVAKKLATAVDPVPCPHCRWLQQDMVAEIGRRRGARLGVWVLGVPGVLAATTLIDFAVVSHWFARPFAALGGRQRVLLLDLFAATPGSFFALYLLRRTLTAWPVTNPADPGGSTDAPAAVELDSAGVPVPVKPPRPLPTTVGPTPWRWLQLADVVVPEACSRCGKPEWATPPERIGSDGGPQLWFHTCAGCRSDRKRRVLFALVDIALLAAGSTAAAWYWLPPKYQPSVQVAAATDVLVVVAGWLVVARKINRPFWLRRFSKDRNTAQVRFKSPSFDSEFARANPGRA